MELIDRKALLDMIDKEILGTSDCILQNRLLGVGAYVLSMPTVDNVPVVRCKDCKHWNSNTGWCKQHSHFWDEHNKFCYPWESNEWKMFNENDFCSDGALRTSCEVDAKYEKTFGMALKEKLEEKHMSQKMLAKKTGMTEASISRYIKDERSPNLKALLKITDALGCTIDELVRGKKV